MNMNLSTLKYRSCVYIALSISFIIIASFILFFKSIIVNYIWNNSPAPWEYVDAVYLSSGYLEQLAVRDPSSIIMEHDFQSIDECMEWLTYTASEMDNSTLIAGRHACLIGRYDVLKWRTDYPPGALNEVMDVILKRTE